MRTKAGALAGGIALLLGGCGSSGQDAAKSAVTDYLHALLRYDGGAACAKLSRATKTEYERLGRGKPCGDLLTAEAKRQLTGQVKQRLQQAKVVKVRVTGATAAATVSVPGRTSTISLVKQGGGWKIESPLG